MTSELMDGRELANRLGKSSAALANWRYLGQGPKFIKVGRSIRYRVADVESWLEAHTQQQTGS